jgi:hypothetical protein
MWSLQQQFQSPLLVEPILSTMKTNFLKCRSPRPLSYASVIEKALEEMKLLGVKKPPSLLAFVGTELCKSFISAIVLHMRLCYRQNEVSKSRNLSWDYNANMAQLSSQDVESKINVGTVEAERSFKQASLDGSVARLFAHDLDPSDSHDTISS